MPDYIDVHSHVHFAAFDLDREEVIKRALDAGVWMINVGTNKATSKGAVELAEKHGKGVYSIIGIHPIHSVPSFHDKSELGEHGDENKGETFDYDFYKNLGIHPKVLGIGEVGLDYFRVEGEENFKKQEENFVAQIELANELKKPLMLHIRNPSASSGQVPSSSLRQARHNRSAYKDVLKLLNGRSKVRGNVHFFVGSSEEAKEFFDLGFTVSFTGVITFTEDYRDLVKYAPLDKILIETDCPYVAPMPHRGKRNEPLFVKETAKKIAEIKNLPLEEVKTQLIKNTLDLFTGIKIA